MPKTPPTPRFKRIPPGVWAGVIWSASTLFSLRVYSGLPGMPDGQPPLGPAKWLLVTVAALLALTGCRLLPSRPLTALGLLLSGSLLTALALHSVLISLLHYLAVCVALGFIAATRSRRTRITAFVLTLGVLPVYTVTRLLLGLPLEYPHDNADGGWTGWLPFALMALVGWLVGGSVRQTREYAERLSSQSAAQAVTAERLRIARELHDMVAHSIGIIALQAGAAVRVLETQPAGAREALTNIETTGRDTLSGLRRMLGSLREAGEEEVPLGSQPSLSDIDRLAASTAAAGVRVDVHWKSDRRPLPPEIEVSAYRIVQEAVTNVVRHAGTPSCTVSIECQAEHLSIEVDDAGQGGGGTVETDHGAGWGLTGMRERVGLLHGEFSAGPRPEGGFRVAARLPLPAGSR